MTPSEQAAKQVDALLASYKATKDEISRRSALQWAILAGYSFVLYNAFSATLKSNPRLAEVIAWPTLAWVASSVALLFHRREQLEIMRLSHIISELIEERLQGLELGGLLFERWGFNDEQARRLRYNRQDASFWERIFNIAVFFAGPTALIVVAAVQMTPHSSWPVAVALTVILVCALSIGYLLGR